MSGLVGSFLSSMSAFKYILSHFVQAKITQQEQRTHDPGRPEELLAPSPAQGSPCPQAGPGAGGASGEALGLPHLPAPPSLPCSPVSEEDRGHTEVVVGTAMLDNHTPEPPVWRAHPLPLTTLP